MRRTIALLGTPALGAGLALLGGCTNGTEWEPEAAASVSSPEFAWEAKSYAPKQVLPPSRAATWDWPSESEFEARFARWPSEAWSHGVLIGRKVFVNDDGSKGILDPPEVRLAHRRQDEPTFFVNPEGGLICRGSRTDWRYQEPLSSRDPLSPGELDLGPGRRFHVLSVAQPRRLLPEDWRDWVYARTILDSGLPLAEANSETALSKLWKGSNEADDEQARLRLEQSFIDHEAELANTCYESGLAACYLAGRIEILDDWIARKSLESGNLALPDGLDPNTLDRGPVDLVRFFFGLLLDVDLSDSSVTFCGDHYEPIVRLARMIDDYTAVEPVANELHARALDPQRDPWTRAQLVSLLTALYDLQLARDKTRAPRHASASCALAVLAAPDWTIEEAHARCVGSDQSPDFSWVRQAREDALVAMKLLDQEAR